MEDEAPARALTSQSAETDQIRFLVGTQSLRAENQVHHIDFDDEMNIINKNVFVHREGEIWHMSASTIDKNLLTTCYNKKSKAEMKAALWRLPSDFDSSQSDDQSSHQALHVLWHPTGDSKSLLGLADNHILLWELDTASSSAKLTASTGLESKGQPKMTCGRWNPHHNCTQIATANDNCIRGWDIRSMEQVYVIENAHGQLVRDLDFNPNKQYYLASCGDDCKVKFWDTRNTTEPLKVLSEHSHWVWSVKYNHFHDQMEDPPKDGVIATYEEHEDSVYAVDWSTADPWVFASLSYDGRLVINRVPRAEKYKILL
ncbi:hypothetical protein KUTeg_017152 [Tegillarca granosa]|uniref:EIPR1-like beta-propeller domain-containing protein n=1 Tax=Tegillarca granosa TaxID=220873 RepID=A0ABQ9EMX3_TEGGR|nr:hypothetical protein KUTeg_017152 [Tegillarca granosa]